MKVVMYIKLKWGWSNEPQEHCAVAVGCLSPEQGSEDREGSGCAARAADPAAEPAADAGLLDRRQQGSVRGGCHPAEHRREEAAEAGRQARGPQDQPLLRPE